MKLKKSDINSVLHGVNEEGPGTITQAMHMVKEREIGKLCYQAEEDLLSPGLALLKDMLAVKSSTWNAYKHACLEGFSP